MTHIIVLKVIKFDEDRLVKPFLRYLAKPLGEGILPPSPNSLGLLHSQTDGGDPPPPPLLPLIQTKPNLVR